MIIKGKRWLSRFVAMLCVLTMVVGVLTPASVGVAAGTNNTVKSITLPSGNGIVFYDAGKNNMNDEIELSDNGEVESAGYKYKMEGESIKLIPKESGFNNKFKFYVTGLGSSELKVDNNENILKKSIDLSTGADTYIVDLTNVTDTDLTVLIVSKYTITFPEYDDFYELKEAEGITEDVRTYAIQDQNYSFEAKATDENKSLVVKVNGITKEGIDTQGGFKKYNLENITKNITIAFSTTDKTYNITLPVKKEGYSIVRNSPLQIKYGEPFSFYVNPDEGYKAPIVSIDSGEGTLSAAGNNLYVINDIKSNITISISNIEKNTYSLYYDRGNGYEIDAKDEPSVVHGTDKTFKVTPSKGYEISMVTYNGKVATANGTSLPDNAKEYTIKITSDTTVNVSVRKIQYTITYKTNSGSESAYTLRRGASAAEYGSYTFWVTPNDGYAAPTVKIGKDEETAKGNDPITPVSENQYVIDITGDTYIVIEAPSSKIQRNITFIESDGYGFYKNDNDEKITSPVTVYDGDNYTFKLKLDTHYNQSNPIVTINGTPLLGKKDSDSAIYTYNINNIKADQTVAVTGVEKNTYKVTLTNGENYTISPVDNTNVKAEDSFRFRVVSSPGYNAITVNNISASNEQKVVNDKNGTTEDYIIENLTADTIIKIENLTTVTIKADITTSVRNAKVTPENGYDSENIHFDKEFKFRVDADDYYQVTKVVVDDVVVDDVEGVYTVKNITNDIKVTVLTRANVLTVNYVDNKYDNSEIVEYYVGKDDTVTGSGVVTLKKFDDTSKLLYKFTGWDYNGSTKETVNINEDKDTEITLTAKWEINKELIKNNITVSTISEWGSTNKKDEPFKITFKSTINKLINDLNEEEKSKVRLTGYGTLYSRKNINTGDYSVENEILKRNGDIAESGTLYKAEVANGEIFNYYYSDVNFTVDEVMNGNNNVFSLNLTSPKKCTRYARAWIELTIGDGEDKVIIFGDKDAFLTPQSE